MDNRTFLTYQANLMTSGSYEYCQGYASALAANSSLTDYLFEYRDVEDYKQWVADGKPWDW